MRCGNYDRALDEPKRAVALNSSDADSYDGLGAALLFIGDFDGAVKAIELSSEFQPTLSVTTYFNLGTALLLSGRIAEFRSNVGAIRRAISELPICPSHARCGICRGRPKGRRGETGSDGSSAVSLFYEFPILDLSLETRKIAEVRRGLERGRSLIGA